MHFPPTHVDKAQDSYDTEDRAEDIRRAEENGCTVVYPEGTHLLLDLDSVEDKVRFKKTFDLLKAKLDAKILDKWISKGGTGRHVVIQVNRTLSHVERIALQAALGSDGKREIISLIRLWGGKPHPSLLFRPK